MPHKALRTTMQCWGWREVEQLQGTDASNWRQAALQIMQLPLQQDLDGTMMCGQSLGLDAGYCLCVGISFALARQGPARRL
eukprot:4202716-Amphidinium_carterae.2